MNDRLGSLTLNSLLLTQHPTSGSPVHPSVSESSTSSGLLKTSTLFPRFLPRNISYHLSMILYLLDCWSLSIPWQWDRQGHKAEGNSLGTRHPKTLCWEHRGSQTLCWRQGRGPQTHRLMRYGKASRISLIPLFKTVALANSLNQGCSPSYSRFNTHTGRQHVSSSSQGTTTTQITDLCDKGSLISVNLTDPASLQDQIFDKQPQGIGIHADQGKKDYNQKKRTRTSSQTTQTQPLLLKEVVDKMHL